MIRRIRGLSHGTVVAYLALFFALGGSAIAAHSYLITSTRQIKPSVLHRLHGARGPRGATGSNGKNGKDGVNGASGPTTLTSPPAYTLLAGDQIAINNMSSDPSNDEWQRNNLYTFTTVTTPQVGTFRTYLLSPSQLAGSTAHLGSVDFCYGLQNSSLGAAQPANVSITRATVYEFDEPDGNHAAGPVPAYSTPTATLLDAPLSIQGTAGGYSNCQTVTAPGAPAISSGGYLALDLQVSFTAPSAPSKSNGNSFQGWVYFGRVTTTYTP